MPASPLGGTSGGAWGPYAGWWNGHAHWPAHWVAGFPTHAYAARLRASIGPCVPHRLMQKPSTATSCAVSTSAMPPPPPALAGRARAASAGSWDSFRLFPSEHASSVTWPVRATRAFLAPPPCAPFLLTAAAAALER
uniref:Uncharacterized protein n=1 Tax=Arundo donax TaxID=35708 RepID=A0A0A9DU40_ARUDO